MHKLIKEFIYSWWSLWGKCVVQLHKYKECIKFCNTGNCFHQIFFLWFIFWTISRRSSMIVLPLQGNQSKFSVEDLRVLNVSPLPMIVYQRMPLGMYIEPPRGRKVINITPRLYVGVSLMSLWVTVLTAHAPPLLSIKVSAHGCCVSQALILVFLWRIRPYNRNQLLTNQNSTSFFKILLLLLCHSFV